MGGVLPNSIPVPTKVPGADNGGIGLHQVAHHRDHPGVPDIWTLTCIHHQVAPETQNIPHFPEVLRNPSQQSSLQGCRCINHFPGSAHQEVFPRMCEITAAVNCEGS